MSLHLDLSDGPDDLELEGVLDVSSPSNRVVTDDEHDDRQKGDGSAREQAPDGREDDLLLVAQGGRRLPRLVDDPQDPGIGLAVASL
jgi:hypothetical protein